MNEWHDMDEELKQAQRLNETHVLDASNVNVGFQNRRAQGIQPHPDLIHAGDKELQDSSLMAFENRASQDNQQQVANIDQHNRVADGLLHASRLASVSISDFDWKYENFGFGFYQYVVETSLKTQAEPFMVRRRYSEFKELYKLLQLELPGCIIPPVPPKTATTKFKGKESEESQERKAGLEKFLQMLIVHPHLSQSPILEAFLTEDSSEQFTMAKYIQQIDGQFSKAYLLDCAEVFQEETAIGDFQSQGVSAILQQTNKMLKDTIWGSQKAQMGDAFGEFLEQAKEELTTFKRQEDYLQSLEQAYTSLISSVTAQIQAQQETSQNLVEMAQSFQKVRQMKGAENSQVTQAVCNISNPFNQAAQTSSEVADKMRAEVLSLVVFDQSYLQEAKRTFLRWRALVTRYYVLVNTIEKTVSQLRQMGNQSQAQSIETENQAKTAERDAIRDSMPAVKRRIIEEIELFQARFNKQTQLIVQRYTELHQQSAQVQLQYWEDYLRDLQIN